MPGTLLDWLGPGALPRLVPPAGSPLDRALCHALPRSRPPSLPAPPCRAPQDLFRRDPSHPRVASLRTLPTERGTKLIVSGWWGIARHINYTGDWLMGCGRRRCVLLGAGYWAN